MRWWDGARWTEHRAATPGGAAPPPAARTSGWAIASLVLGIIGGSVLAIVFGFVARSKIKGSGGALRGSGLATAGIVLGFAWLALLAVVLALAATGALENSNAEDFSGREKPVAQAVDDIEAALRADDYDKVCGEQFTAAFAIRVSRGADKPCPAFLGEEEGIQEELDVQRILVAGERATAFVEEGDDPQTWILVREGGRWRVDDIRS